MRAISKYLFSFTSIINHIVKIYTWKFCKGQFLTEKNTTIYTWRNNNINNVKHA